MNVHGVGGAVPPAATGPQAGQSRRPEGSSASAGDIIKPSHPGAQGEANGVVRLLQEGHFQGVSAVRLSINFHAQLGTAQRAAASSSLSDGVAELLTTVGSLVDEFVASGTLDESQVESLSAAHENFANAVSGLLAQFQSESEVDTEAFFTSLQATFDEFESALIGLFGAAGELGEAGGEESGVTTESEVVTFTLNGEITQPGGESLEGGIDFTAFLDALRDAFGQALTDLAVSFESVEASTASFGEPNGNGVAFAKFLDVLQGLTGTEPAAESAPVPEVDTEA